MNSNIVNRALIVNLSISQWTARKLDKNITNKVNREHNAASDAGRYNKLLIANEALKEIQKTVNAARAFHYSNALKWGDSNGDGLLTVDNYDYYVSDIEKFKDKFSKEVAKFIENYPALIEDAKQRLNGMFNIIDYPKPEEIASKFSFRVSYLPVADLADWRITLPQQERNRILEHANAEYNARIENTNIEILTRIKTQLEYTHERLKDVDAVFRDSLFNNIKELAELLPRLNITGNPEIYALCDELKTLYRDPESVRNNKRIRQETTETIAATIRKIKI